MSERAGGFASSARPSRARFALSLMLAGSVCLATWGGHAHAQGRVVTISEVTIVGRVQKPIAAVDVSRIQPRLTLAELRQKFTDRIERALYRAPF
ncbi:MAG TPA: hypothetical protein VN764_18550 [Polyangiaceae bacterium]|nr:hypothetical protein [Polyangiaceae bacterium]